MHRTALRFAPLLLAAPAFAQTPWWSRPEVFVNDSSNDRVTRLLDLVRKEVTRIVFTVQIRSQEDIEETAPRADVQNVQYQHAGFDETQQGEGDEPPPQQQADAGPKVGRNDPCPCGSGKKYKHCHGKLS